MPITTVAGRTSTSRKPPQRRRPRTRARVVPRRATAGRPKGSPSTPSWFRRQMDWRRARRDGRRARRAFTALRRDALALLTRDEVETLARECGFYQRTPRAIRAFEFGCPIP